VEWQGKRVGESTFAFDSGQSGDYTLRVGKKPAVIIRIEAQ
jgi:hypothetical protein